MGVLVTAVPRDALSAAAVACGVVDRRAGGKLPVHVTAYLTMAMWLFPLCRAFDAVLRPARFRTKPPACYRAS